MVGDGNKMKEMQSSISEIIDQRSLIHNVSKTYLFVKRFLDIAVALTAILVHAPILLITILWIKIRSRGALFHVEDKYGLRGISFHSYEFSKIKSRYIGQLPQLFNVLKGHMSLVGPMPASTQELSKDAWYNLRMSAKPGITGLWQVSGKDGGVNEMVRVDLKYIRERSLWNDFKIALKAMRLMFKKGPKFM